MVNDSGSIIHKVGYKKGNRHDYDIYKENYPVYSQKEVVNVCLTLDTLGIRKGLSRTKIISTRYKKKRI